MFETGYRARLYSRYASTHGLRSSADDRPSRWPYLEQLVRLRFPCDRSARIFEIGCGAGNLIACLREAGYSDVGGVDASLEQATVAAQRGIAGVEHGDLFDALARLGAETKDVIVAFDVIEHLTKAEMLRLADEVLRVLAPGGIWIMHTVNGESPFFGRVRYGDFTHEAVFTRTSIRQVLSCCGFSEIACFEDTPVIHGAVSLCRAGLWQFVRGALRIVVAAETGDPGGDSIFSQNFVSVARK